MCPQREPLRLVVGEDLFQIGGGGKLLAKVVFLGFALEEGIITVSLFLRQCIPERGAAVEGKRAKGIGSTQPETGAAGEVLDRAVEAVLPAGNDLLGDCAGQAANHPQP